MRWSHLAAISALAFAISACTVIPESARTPATPSTRPRPAPRPAPAPVPTTPRPTPAPLSPSTATTPVTDGMAASAGVILGPDLDTLLPADSARLADALRAFRATCPSLMRRTDTSGLTAGSDWQSACSNAASWSDGQAREFFRRNFEAVQIADGRAYATGYYEPEIAGCRTPTASCATPLYRRPDNLIDVDLGKFSEALKGKTIRGKVSGTNFIPFDERAEITAGSLSGRGLEIAYANDPIELFFLEVQGSGRLRQPDGSILRVGYAGQNGRDYTGIGKLMKDRGLIKAGSMQDIMQWLRANPVDGRRIMNENRSYIFFRELTGAGPLGALGIAVTPRATVAADPKYVPLGAPVLLTMDRDEANGLWVAQDTGGAIKGSNRFDTFWGAGSDARTIAGGMSARGNAWLLLPIGTAARLAPR
ncbi:murein transglycosylase A [Sphingobium sufflavum]|uniref:murein transglycosylase A n=1 Tax=Sphingobium sufflavum TaxID=1129547 RepID=UPI001F35D0B3|nr:murein transglycosylase A [Sphingobium sufflavum]MCE7795724.1 murein transglycosylase A [Sphingobium sufflavum]